MKKLSKTELKKINAGVEGGHPLGDCMVTCGAPGPTNPGHYDCVADCMEKYAIE